ncbi:MAG TPA: SNF2-related protein [Candidatus Glassbacteria bacterium]|nr:SNF2-related protein [Candidatus Glassbacteria bacterium]
MNWYKIASYSYVEDILSTLRRFFPIVSEWNDPQGKSLATNISASFAEISRLSQSEYGTEEYKRLMQALIRGRSTMYTASKRMKEEERHPNLRSDFEETGTKDKVGWLMWEREGNIKDKVIVNKNTSPPQIVLLGLDLGDSKVAQFIHQYMGDWASQQEDGVHVRGTRESWNRFLSISNQWLENHKILKSKTMQLPFEKEFDPNYQEEVVEKKRKPGEGHILGVAPLNIKEMEGSISTEGLMRGKAYPGIRLSFDPKDPNLYEIRDYIDGVGRKNFIFNRQEGYFDIFEQGDVEGGAEGLNKKTLSALSWGKIKKRLQFIGYKNTGDIDPLIEKITGIKSSKAYEQKAKKTKSEGESDTVVRGRINLNVLEKLQVSDRFNVPVGQGLDQRQFYSLLEENYPGAFGEGVSQAQKDAQKKGMYFMASRTVSVLADQPGSGKTPMAVVASDATRNEGQKILVITPNMLVRENWLDVDEKNRPIAKAPGQFCGHTPDQIAVCKKTQDLTNATSNPKVVWVIVPISAFSRKGQATQDFSNTIVNISREGKFSSVIVDEIQTVKNLDGVTFNKLAKAISPYYIPHRIGLTGTPSDNNPEDIYSQLLLLDHPVLYKDFGTENWVSSLNQKGFAKRFLGGEELAKRVTVPKHWRDQSTEEEVEDKQAELWKEKAKKILEWVNKLDDSNKLLILDLFSSTYLRRTKEDIRPDIPPKQRDVEFLPSPTGVEMPEANVNWHNSFLKKLAHEKVPYTIQSASSVLSGDPLNKVFIVTKHPEIADQIMEELNKTYGDGTAAAVHQKTSGPGRSRIAREFKMGEGQGLRAVIYTMQLGAVGLNFDIASSCIFNDLDWNPSNNLQAEDRIHRITSKKPVDIKYMVFDNGYDMEMYNRVQKKESINDGVSDMIRQSNLTTDVNERLLIANNFVKYLIESSLIDVGLSKQDQDWFDQQIEISLTTPGVQQPIQQVASNWYSRIKYYTKSSFPSSLMM